MDETVCLVGKLRANLISYEEECCEKRKKLDDCAQGHNKLKKANCTFEMELNCVKENLHNSKLCASRAEEKWNLERETLSNELNTKCKKLHDLEMQYNEANTTINENACKIKTLETTLKDVKEVSLKKHDELKYLVQKLKEFSTKETNLCKLKNDNNQLKQENELIVMEINSLKNKLKEKECQLNELQLLLKKTEQIKQKSCNTSCSLKKPLINTCSVTSMESTSDACCSSSKLMQSITQKYKQKPNKKNCNKMDLNNVQFELDNFKNDVDQIFKIYDS